MVYKKRNQWCFKDDSGNWCKFNTEEEAIAASGSVVKVEVETVELEVEDMAELSEEETDAWYKV